MTAGPMFTLSRSVTGVSASVLALLLLLSVTVARADDWAERVGDVGVVVIPAVGYLATFAKDDAGGRAPFYESFTSTLVLTCALKIAVDKPRPENSGGFAFPSAHAALAFQGAAFIQRRYGWRCGMPAYLGAAYVAWSRLEGEPPRHDGYDVSAGAVIGVLSSYCFTSRFKGVSVVPAVGRGKYLLAVSRQW